MASKARLSRSSSNAEKKSAEKDTEYKNEYGVASTLSESSEGAMMEFTFKVIIIGNLFVGKTSFVNRYVNNKFDRNYKATMGVDFFLKVIKWSDDISIKLQLWDIAGQESLNFMTRGYYKGAHACIIMFDLTQKSTFHKVVKWKRDLDEKCTMKDGSTVPSLLLANKCDLVDERQVSFDEIEEMCRELDFIGWCETSVKEGTMIHESMGFLVRRMAKSKEMGDFQDSLRSDVVKVGEKPESRFSRCFSC